MNRRQFFGVGVGALAGMAAGCSASVPGSPTSTSPPVSGSTTSSPATSSPASSSTASGTTAAGRTAVTTAAAAAELKGTGARMAGAPAATAAGPVTRFGAQLFIAAAPGTGNAVLSPYSVLVALGMTAFGAKGDAAQALTRVLGGDAMAVAAALTAVDAALALAVASGNQQSGEQKTSEFVIEAANRLFAQSSLAVRQEFLDALATGYDAAMQTLDFRADPDAARSVINAWVAEKTRRLIPTLLGPGTVTTDTRLALVNAVYLKAPWAEEFGTSDTATSFTRADGSAVPVPLLRQTSTMPLAKGDGWSAVSILYHGGDLAMTVLLPDAGKFANVNARPDGPMLIAAASGQNARVRLQLPAFTIDTPTDLTGPLSDLGLKALFGGDLSGIAGEPGDLIVTQVVHQAKISVDEHGTEAAAATAVIGAAGAPAPAPTPDPVDFVVDRAFLYVVHDTKTLCPLFIGRVDDPTA